MLSMRAVFRSSVEQRENVTMDGMTEETNLPIAHGWPCDCELIDSLVSVSYVTLR